jgi:hypothetical protein
LRPLHTQETPDFAPGDVKAETKFVVGVHALSPPSAWPAAGRCGTPFRTDRRPGLR